MQVFKYQQQRRVEISMFGVTSQWSSRNGTSFPNSLSSYSHPCFSINSGLYLKENGSFILLFYEINPYLTPSAQQPKFLVLSELVDQIDGCEIFKPNLSDHLVYVPFPSTPCLLNSYVPYSTANHWTGNKDCTLLMT